MTIVGVIISITAVRQRVWRFVNYCLGYFGNYTNNKMFIVIWLHPLGRHFELAFNLTLHKESKLSSVSLTSGNRHHCMVFMPQDSFIETVEEAEDRGFKDAESLYQEKIEFED